MRLQQYINEGFEVLQDIKLITKDRFNYVYEGIIKDDDNEYKLKINMRGYGKELWSISFLIYKNKKIAASKIEPKNLSITKTIIEMVMKATKDFIKKENPEELSFTNATGMKGARKLYDRFAKMIIKSGKYNSISTDFPEDYEFRRIK